MLQDTIHTAFSASLFSSLTCLEKLVTLATVQASMKLSKEQVVSLSNQEMVQNFLISQKHRISDSVKQTLAVAEIFKLEDLKVALSSHSKAIFSKLSYFRCLSKKKRDDLDFVICKGIEGGT
jgi:hypothetical protein